METIAVERSIWIAAPRERVWRAITDPEQLTQWYAPGCPWDIPALQVGATVTFYNTDTDIQRGTIEVVAPPHQLTLRWQPDQTYPATTLVTTFLLAEEHSGTQVTIIEAGYESLPENVRQHRLDETAQGYGESLELLKVYLEQVSHQPQTNV
jgi:uncharacterized protein YndB with AHSA1/START domain